MNKPAKPLLEFYSILPETEPCVPVMEASVHAGFPIPVDSAYMAQPIDLNKELIKNPATSYLVRVSGDSMTNEGIDDGDLLVVDRSIYPSERNITVCMVDGEFALKRIIQKDGQLFLKSGNPKYNPIAVDNPDELQVFGVVRWVLKKK